MPVPQVPGGLAPQVALSYSSGGVDGRTGEHQQPGLLGRRRLRPVARLHRAPLQAAARDDGDKNADGNKPGDLCWGYDNATVSFNGTAGELIPTGTDAVEAEERRRHQDRPDLRLRRRAANGDDDDEYWKVTTPDGTQYYFGYNRLPGWATGKPRPRSAWTVPVFGNDAGEPCHAATFADSWCQQAWRWNLDYVVDPHGNAIAYYYDQGDQLLRPQPARPPTTPRTSAAATWTASSTACSHGDVYADEAAAPRSSSPTAERCLPRRATTARQRPSRPRQSLVRHPVGPELRRGHRLHNGRLSPAFFTRKRLTGVTTQVLQSDGAYSNVDAWELAHQLGHGRHRLPAAARTPSSTPARRQPRSPCRRSPSPTTQLANRLDKTGDGCAPFIKYRLSTIADESGGQIDVNYTAPACDADSPADPGDQHHPLLPAVHRRQRQHDDPDSEWFNKYVVDTVIATDRTGGAPDQVTTLRLPGRRRLALRRRRRHDQGEVQDLVAVARLRPRTGADRRPGRHRGMQSQTDRYFLRGMDGDRKTTAAAPRA